MINILLADDHPLILKGTSDYIQSLGYTIIGTYTNGLEAYNNIKLKTPDIAILDISMPGLDGLEIAKKMLQTNISTKVILLTMHKEISFFREAQLLDVKGYLLKDFAIEELANCIEIVLNNKIYFSNQLNFKAEKENEIWKDKLTTTEQKILFEIASQKTSKEISNTFFISDRTVETHRRNIIRKLDIPNERNALFLWCLTNIAV